MQYIVQILTISDQKNTKKYLDMVQRSGRRPVHSTLQGFGPTSEEIFQKCTSHRQE